MWQLFRTETDLKKKREGRKKNRQRKRNQLTLPTEVCNFNHAAIALPCVLPLVECFIFDSKKFWYRDEKHRRNSSRISVTYEISSPPPPLNRDSNEAWWRSIFPLRGALKFQAETCLHDIEIEFLPERETKYKSDSWPRIFLWWMMRYGEDESNEFASIPGLNLVSWCGCIPCRDVLSMRGEDIDFVSFQTRIFSSIRLILFKNLTNNGEGIIRWIDRSIDGKVYFELNDSLLKFLWNIRIYFKIEIRYHRRYFYFIIIIIILFFLYSNFSAD